MRAVSDVQAAGPTSPTTAERSDRAVAFPETELAARTTGTRRPRRRSNCGEKKTSTGALVARAGAAAHARGAAFGWALLQEIPDEAIRSYQPYWALAAELLEQLGRIPEACAALERAIGLAENPAPRSFLIKRLTELRARGGEGAAE